jgi:ATP-dependent DNA ligase
MRRTARAEFFEGDGEILFEHACKLGCEGIVSKRLGSRYRHGGDAVLIAFDLIELEGEDLRGSTIEHRAVSQLVCRSAPHSETTAIGTC